MFKYRPFLFAAIASIVMIVMGIGETLRGARSLLGPSSVPFSQASTQGLAGYGYVRITGVRSDLEHSVVVMKQKKSRFGGEVKEARWAGAYVPIHDASATGPAPCSLLAWLPHARADDDLASMEELSGPANDELVGFVECPYEKLDFAQQRQIAPLAMVNTRSCWVVDVRPPSWLKGLGLTLAGIAIPGIAAMVKLKKGFV